MLVVAELCIGAFSAPLVICSEGVRERCVCPNVACFVLHLLFCTALVLK